MLRRWGWRQGGVVLLALVLVGGLAACGDDDGKGPGMATVRIHNDFDNPDLPRQPPWTICHAWYNGTYFDKVGWGETSEALEVRAGLGLVYMIAAWDDPTCSEAKMLPIASKIEEETLVGQERTITIGLTNHQGPCPPEGVQPIPEEAYEQVRSLWAQYTFKPYAERTENPQCLAD